MLSLDWATIAFQIVNFLILAGVLYFVLFRPATRGIKERVAERKRLKQESAQERQEAERARAELEKRLADVKGEAEQIVARAQKEAEARRQELLDETELEVERILEEGRSEAERLQQQALDQFHGRLLDTILDVSVQIIGQVAPPEVHDRLVGQINERIWEMGRSEMERVEAFRRSLGDRTPTARVTTARALSEDQQGELARTLSALADRNVDIEVGTDPSLGAGMRVRLIDILIENTIAGQLEGLRASVSEALKERDSQGDE
jgi:F-type H+-transporting ATPase subunit b